MPGQPGAAGGVAGGGVGNPNSRYSWAIAILHALGVDGNKDTNALVLMVCWMQAENGQTENNPLGCTLEYHGSVADPNTTSGLMKYKTKEDGAAATAQNIKGGYPTILHALTSNKDYVGGARDISQTNWGTGGLVISVALSVKGSGGFNSAIYKSYAWRNVKTTGSSRWRDVPFIGDSIANTQASLQNTYDAVTGGFGAIGDFVGKLTDPHTWYRAAQILLGAIFLFIGVMMLFRNSSAGQAIASAAPMGKMGKSSGGAKAPKVGTELTPEAVPA